MAKNITATANIENAEIMKGGFTSFSGTISSHNKYGKKQITVKLNLEDAEELKRIGFPVIILPPRNEGEDPLCFLTATIKEEGYYKTYIETVTQGIVTTFDPEQDDIGNLDNVNFEEVDIMLRMRHWRNDFGKEGDRCEVAEFHGLVAEDTSYLRRKWADRAAAMRGDIPTPVVEPDEMPFN